MSRILSKNRLLTLEMNENRNKGFDFLEPK